ncbi:unnamed protein product [Clavelina lepadiformis]|uniref:Ion transport domain-containing protein n=1 Tax=Clavelina lepadiformis TaxID=159417 RepID=A0ABP0FEA8_CLALP
MENLQAAFFSKSRTDPINWNKTRATSDLEREQTSTQTPEASTSHGSFNQRTEEKEESQQQGGHTNEDQMRSQNYVPQQKVELLDKNLSKKNSEKENEDSGQKKSDQGEDVKVIKRRVQGEFQKLQSRKLVKSYCFEKVASNNVNDVNVLFSLDNSDFREELVDFRNRHGARALKIAIKKENVKMCETLLDHGVDIGDNLFYAIKRNFLGGVETILKRDACVEAKIEGKKAKFPAGTTPTLLAALNNNYEILKLLHEYKHNELKEPECKRMYIKWEEANLWRLTWEAKTNKEYIVFICEASDKNQLDYCMDQIEQLRKCAEGRQEFRNFCKDRETKLENFMCSLLDEVRSSEELAKLFDIADDKDDGDRKRLPEPQRFLEKASKLKLKKFVTHPFSQLALDNIRYGHFDEFHSHPFFTNFFGKRLLGLCFPFLAIIHLVAPKNKFGSAPPTTLEKLALIWFPGRVIQEIEECVNYGWKNYVEEWWNYNDILQLVLFSITIAFRCVDYYAYAHYDVIPENERIYRADWKPWEPRLLASGFLAWTYVFVFLRTLRLVKPNRILGPLQVSLSRMMVNAIEFLLFFCLVIFAFGLGLTEVYWYDGTAEAIAARCGNATTIDHCNDPFFGNLVKSLLDLYWTLFGYVDPYQIDLNTSYNFTQWVASSLFAMYHVVAIIIMLNMLIAMMSKSYDVISENKEVEWKFQSSITWIHYSRGQFILPPPMNIVPHFFAIYEFCRKQSQKRNTCRKEVDIEKTEGTLRPSGRHSDIITHDTTLPPDPPPRSPLHQTSHISNEDVIYRSNPGAKPSRPGVGTRQKAFTPIPQDSIYTFDDYDEYGDDIYYQPAYNFSRDLSSSIMRRPSLYSYSAPTASSRPQSVFNNLVPVTQWNRKRPSQKFLSHLEEDNENDSSKDLVHTLAKRHLASEYQHTYIDFSPKLYY